MSELHSDALLGGTWAWETDDDELSFEDRHEQRQDEGRARGP